MKEEWLRAGLREMRSGGMSLWDGREKLLVRNAGKDEVAIFQRESKTLPRDKGDLPIVYLVQLY